MPEHQQVQQSKKPDTTFQKQATPISQTPASNPVYIIQRARINPKSLTYADVMHLQRTIGNRVVGGLLSGIASTTQQAIVQRQEIPEEEEPLQGQMIETIQRQEIPEEEEPLQGKMIETIQRQEIPEEEEPLQGKMMGTIQRQEIPEEEEPLQGKFESIQRQEIPEEEEPLQGKMIETIQRQEIPEEEEPLQTKRENNTGMPDNLKAGVENLSRIDMGDVRVHYNSTKPAEVGALAYTQGTDVHVAPGQERHLPHEAWHVVQQAQGRVQATTQMKGLGINDDPSLEQEADMMGAKTAQFVPVPDEETMQRKFGEGEVQKAEKAPNNTGMPDNFKAGIENLSGMSMDGVKVHYNSGKLAALDALAYAQGSDIHLGPGHEAWHVVQQRRREPREHLLTAREAHAAAGIHHQIPRSAILGEGANPCETSTKHAIRDTEVARSPVQRRIWIDTEHYVERRYQDAIRKTGTTNQLHAVYESMGQGGDGIPNGVLLSDEANFHEWLLAGVTERIVLPDDRVVGGFGLTGYADLDFSGVGIQRRFNLIAEHELIHLREAMKNTHGNRSPGAQNPHGLIAIAGGQLRRVTNNLMSLVSLCHNSDPNDLHGNRQQYLMSRLQYVLNVSQGPNGNADAPTVFWELSSFLESEDLTTPTKKAYERLHEELIRINKQLSSV